MKQEKILKKNETVFSDTLGVCQVTEVSKLTTKKGDSILYYRLQSVFNKEKFAYIPAQGHQMQLRDIISAHEGNKLKGNKDFATLPLIQQEEVEYVLSK